MTSYTTQLLDWGEQGTAYPSGYSYAIDVPPIEEYDDFAMFNAIKDIKHLIALTNTRLDSSSGTLANRPANGTDGEVYWNTTDNRVEVWDSGFGGWRSLAYQGEFDSHVSDTSNPHNVTTGQIGAAVAGHLHDDRYYTESEIDATLTAHSTDPDVHHSKTLPSDINSANWNDYEIQKNGSNGTGIINFKTT